MSEHKEQTICPICGKENNCGHTQGLPDGECWCSHIKIPKGLKDLVPEHLRMKACICKDCVDKYISEHGLN